MGWAGAALLVACASPKTEPCQRRNHCRRLADGTVECEPGYTWRDPADPSDLVCVPAHADCGACVPPPAWCRDALSSVTHTTVGCADEVCRFVVQETRCALGCDEVSGLCVGCDTACSSPGAAQCHDGQVRVCAADGNGCLAWGGFVRCGAGVCAGVDACAGCAHGCDATGLNECADGAARACVLDGDGCRRWTDFFPCPSGVCLDAAGCAPPAPPETSSSCSVDGWCWVYPRPNGNRLSSVWGSGARVWAAGSGGTLMRLDGAAWTAAPASWSGAFNAVFGAALNHVWAVGEGGVIWHDDGFGFSPVTSPTNASLHGGWCAAVDDCWAVGDAVILRWQGEAWSPVSVPTGALSLYDVGGSATDDVWAVGYGFGGALLHWDGQSWQSRPGGASTWLRFVRVFVDGAGEVWAAHDSGASGLWRWRDGAWQVVDVGVEATVRAVWGRGDAVWVATDAGLRRWDGAEWRAGGGFSGTTLLDLWADDTGPLWAVGDGGAVLAFDDSWQVRAGVPGAGAERYAAVFGAGEQVWAVGTELGHLDGADWQVTPLPAIGGESYLLTGVSGGPTVRWAVGDNGVVLREAGDGWQVQAQLSGGLRGVWAAADDALWVVSDAGSVAHWAGSVWQSQPLGGGALGLWAIHGSSATDVVAVGGDASVFRFDGGGWSQLHGQYQGDWLTAVWTNGAEIWAGGSDGVFYRWTAGSWSTFPSGVGQGIVALWGVSSREVWAITAAPSGRSTLLRFDGDRWSTVISHAGERLQGLWGSPSADLWAVGAGSAVLRRARLP